MVGQFVETKYREQFMSAVRLEEPENAFHVALFAYVFSLSLSLVRYAHTHPHTYRFCLVVSSWTARPTENYFYGCAYTALWAFGGGIIVPLLVGHNDYYPFPLKDEYAVPILILAYSLHRWFGLIRNLISVRPIRVLLLCTFECARCYMALNWLNVAAKTIPASRFKVPIVGPLIWNHCELWWTDLDERNAFLQTRFVICHSHWIFCDVLVSRNGICRTDLQSFI